MKNEVGRLETFSIFMASTVTSTFTLPRIQEVKHLDFYEIGTSSSAKISIQGLNFAGVITKKTSMCLPKQVE